LLMMGTGTFAEPTFEALLNGPDPVVGLVTQPDRASGVQRGSTRQVGKGMKNIADEMGIPVLQPDSIKTSESLEALRAMKPDLLVVAAYGQILSNAVLEVAPLGAINVHASLLPKYRGAAPIGWAIYHGETHSGVTIIRITLGLDAGDMLAQEAVEILPHETSGELESRLSVIGARLAMDTIAKMNAGPVVGTKQDVSLVTKAPKLCKEDGVIDWTRSAHLVSCQIRAMQPWPTAYTYWHPFNKPSVRLIINASQAIDSTTELSPGSYIASEKQLLIAAGNGTVLEVLELQPAGKKRMSVDAFRRGQLLQSGDRFGAEVLA